MYRSSCFVFLPRLEVEFSEIAFLVVYATILTFTLSGAILKFNLEYNEILSGILNFMKR